MSKKKSLIRNQQGGSEFVEKLIVIALFAFVALVGVKFLGQRVLDKFNQQGNTVESAIPGGVTGG